MSTQPPANGRAREAADGPGRIEDSGRAEASGDLVAMSFPGVRPVAGWLFWVVFPALCAFALWFAVSGLVSHIGDQPSGQSGNYVAHRSCSRGVCLVGGTFVSDDKTVRVESLLGDPRWTDGSDHRVVYDGKSAEVVAIITWDPTTSVLAAVGALTYLAVVGYLGAAVRRSRRDTAQTRK